MGENSAIEWTDHTFNPWTGCTKISDGCANCYADGWAKRSGNRPDHDWGDGHVAMRSGKKTTGRFLDGQLHDGVPGVIHA